MSPSIRNPHPASKTLWLPVILLALLSAAGPAAGAAERTRGMESGLRYLMESQARNGSWDGESHVVAASSLAALALLTGSPEANEARATAVEQARDWLVRQQRGNGQIGDQMVEHAAATLFLSQSLILRPPEGPRVHELRDAIQAAADFIVEIQSTARSRPADEGGWHYRPGFARSELYYSGWQILALYSARQTGIQIEDEVFDAAIAFIKRCRQREGYGSQPPFSAASSRAYRSHTGVALLAARLISPDPTTLEQADVLEWFGAVPPTWGGAQYRGHFFGMLFFQAQFYRHLGGADWEAYRQYLFQLLLRQQRGDGRWDSPESSDEAGEDAAFATALAILILSAETRDLPIFWPRDLLLGPPAYP